jgi:hypothetical protein
VFLCPPPPPHARTQRARAHRQRLQRVHPPPRRHLLRLPDHARREGSRRAHRRTRAHIHSFPARARARAASSPFFPFLGSHTLSLRARFRSPDAFQLLCALAERHETQHDALAPDALPRATALLRARRTKTQKHGTRTRKHTILHFCARFLTRCRARAALSQEAVLRFNSRTKVDAVRQKVESVKATMSENIDKVLERGERLDDVAAKSETMRDQAAAFRAKGRQLRRQLWWQNAKWSAALAAVVLLVAFAVFLAACRGFSCVHKQ